MTHPDRPAPGEATSDAQTQTWTERTRGIHARVSPARWKQIVTRAHERVAVLTQMAAEASGESLRRRLGGISPAVHWPTYLHWRRCAERHEGAPWERQLDGRVAPEPDRVSAELRMVVCLARRLRPEVSPEEAQALAIAELGSEKGKISPASVKRIWKAAGLSRAPGRAAVVGGPAEEVTRFHGGAAFAFLAAAAAETGAVEAMAKAAKEQAEAMAKESSPTVTEEPAGRDEHGRFTGAYNRAVRGTSTSGDLRWRPDAEKRKQRDLSTLTLRELSPETLGHRLLAMALTPLLTERRGFDGLDGPRGDWLGVLGGTAYRPATLDRTLAELALVDAGAALWPCHARQWARLTAPWREGEGAPRWLQWAIYVDATQEPYWTHAYAASGKVSHVGRVMPCLTRVAIMGGAGVPLLVETKAGTVSLKKELLPSLERLEGIIGEGELGRLTIVDAEMATLPLIEALSAREGKRFITVLKGPAAKSAQRTDEGEWEAFREKDRIRELRVHVKSVSDAGAVVSRRAVEMVREGSRNPTSTLFVTNASSDDLSTLEVPTAYLSRWPHQEQRFRDGRNGLGLDRTHGYGGASVTHVALLTALERAASAELRAAAKLETERTAEASARMLHDAAKPEHRAAAKDNVRRAEKARRDAEKRLADRKAEHQRLSTTPREIYVRDTTRDGVVTCLELMALMLIEYVLKEYFGGARMEIRTFIEQLAHLAVTTRTTTTEVLYEIAANPRNPPLNDWLRRAAAETTRRKVRVGERVLRLAIVDVVNSE